MLFPIESIEPLEFDLALEEFGTLVGYKAYRCKDGFEVWTPSLTSIFKKFETLKQFFSEQFFGQRHQEGNFEWTSVGHFLAQVNGERIYRSSAHARTSLNLRSAVIVGTFGGNFQKPPSAVKIFGYTTQTKAKIKQIHFRHL